MITVAAAFNAPSSLAKLHADAFSRFANVDEEEEDEEEEAAAAFESSGANDPIAWVISRSCRDTHPFRYIPVGGR